MGGICIWASGELATDLSSQRKRVAGLLLILPTAMLTVLIIVTAMQGNKKEENLLKQDKYELVKDTLYRKIPDYINSTK